MIGGTGAAFVHHLVAVVVDAITPLFGADLGSGDGVVAVFGGGDPVSVGVDLAVRVLPDLKQIEARAARR